MGSTSCPNCGAGITFSAGIAKTIDKKHATPDGMSHWENHVCSECGHKFGIKFNKAEHNR